MDSIKSMDSMLLTFPLFSLCPPLLKLGIPGSQGVIEVRPPGDHPILCPHGLQYKDGVGPFKDPQRGSYSLLDDR